MNWKNPKPHYLEDWGVPVRKKPTKEDIDKMIALIKKNRGLTDNEELDVKDLPAFL